MNKTDNNTTPNIPEEWYAEAKKQTLDTLPQYMSHILNDFLLDYNIIVYAVSACALAAAYAVNNFPHGGITGFQAGFVEQCIIIDYTTEERIAATELFSIYSRWAKANNEFEMSSKKFFTEITKKLPEKGRNNRGIYYSKIRFTDYVNSLSGRQYRMEDFK